MDRTRWGGCSLRGFAAVKVITSTRSEVLSVVVGETATECESDMHTCAIVFAFRDGALGTACGCGERRERPRSVACGLWGRGRTGAQALPRRKVKTQELHRDFIFTFKSVGSARAGAPAEYRPNNRYVSYPVQRICRLHPQSFLRASR